MAEKILAYKVTVRGTEEQVKELTRHELALKKLGTETRLMEKRAIELSKQNKQGGIEYKGLTKRISENRAKIIDLRTEKNKLAKSLRDESKLNQTNARTIGQVNAQLSIEKARINDVVVGSKKFNVIARRIKDLERKQRDFNQQLGRGRQFVGEYSKGAVDAFKKVGLAVGGALIAFRALQRITGGAIDTVADFEKTFTNVLTLLGTKDAEKFREPLKKGVVQIIKDYGLAFEDVNKALFDAISAGIPAAESIEFLNKTAILAVGGTTTLTAALEGTTKILNAYDLEASKAEKITNALFTAQKVGVVTVQELSENIGTSTGLAKLAGIGFEELLATFAVLSKQTKNTEETFTIINAIITSLTKVAPAAQKEFEKLGIETGITALKNNGLFETLRQVQAALIDNEDKITVLIPSIRGLKGVAALGTEQFQLYDDTLKLINEDIGETSSLMQALALQQETLTDKSNIFVSTLKALVLAFADGLKPALKGVVDIGIDTLNFFIENERTIKGLLKILVSLVGIYIAWKGTLIASNLASKALNASQVLLAATSNRLAVLQRFAAIQTTGLTIAQKAQRIATIAGAVAMRILNAVMKANPIGLVVIAITALIGGLKLLEKVSERNIVLIKRTGELNEQLKNALNDTKDAREKNNEKIEMFNKLSKLEQDTIIQTIKNQKLKAIADLEASKRRIKDIVEQAAQLTLLQKIQVGLFSFGNTARAVSLSVSKSMKNVTEATEGFDEEINQLKQDIIDFDKTQSDLIKTQAQLESERLKQSEENAKALTEAQIKEVKKRAEENKKIREQFAEERRLALLTEEQRELDALKKRVVELTKAGADEVEITKFSVEETARIREKFRQKEANELLKEIQDRVKAEQDGMALRLFILTQELNEGKISEEKFKEEKLRIRKETLEGIKDLLQAELNEMTASLEAASIEQSLLTDEQKEALILKIQEIKAELSGLEFPTAEDEKLSSLAELLGIDEEGIEALFTSIDAVKNIISEVGNLQNTITNEKIKANNKETTSLTKNIDAQIAKAEEQGQNIEQLEKRKQEIIEANNEKNKIIAEEGFKRNKRLQIGFALISGAQAVLAVLAAPPSTDLISDGIIRAIRIATAITAAGIQVATISKQTLEEGGILSGPSHKEGGIDIVVGGKVVANAEGNEIIVNENIHSRPDFVDAISEMNYITGGRRFQRGGILPTPNVTRIQQQAIFQDALTREEAVELIQEGIATIKVEQIESEVTETQKIIETIESGTEF